MNTFRRYWVGGFTLVAFSIVFIVPFLFIVITAMKNAREASSRSFSLPTSFHFFENFIAVLQAQDYMLLAAFMNSIILTAASVTLLVIFGAMIGYTLHRRPNLLSGLVNFLVLFGLMMPPAVVPTIWVLQMFGLFKTLPGMILIEVAYGLSFSILLFRAFVSTIPKELDEAAIMDGAGPLRIFFQVVLPLMRPVMITVIVVQTVVIFNDFTNPLYYLPGNQNVTVQLTLYNFLSQYHTSYNLLFMNILLITIPPLVMFIFFNRQIVSGMTAGAVKG